MPILFGSSGENDGDGQSSTSTPGQKTQRTTFSNVKKENDTKDKVYDDKDDQGLDGYLLLTDPKLFECGICHQTITIPVFQVTYLHMPFQYNNYQICKHIYIYICVCVSVYADYS